MCHQLRVLVLYGVAFAMGSQVLAARRPFSPGHGAYSSGEQVLTLEVMGG